MKMNESTKTASVVALQCVLNYLLFNFLYFFSLLQNNFLFEKPPPTSVIALLENDSICLWKRMQVPCPHFHCIALYNDPKVPHRKYPKFVK